MDTEITKEEVVRFFAEREGVISKQSFTEEAGIPYTTLRNILERPELKPRQKTLQKLLPTMYKYGFKNPLIK
jgi:predicted transcriptional regulator